VKWVPGLSRG